jgi:hypothetical protein
MILIEDLDQGLFGYGLEKQILDFTSKLKYIF